MPTIPVLQWIQKCQRPSLLVRRGPIDCRSTSRNFFILILVCMATAITSPSQIFSTVFSFYGSNGSQPNGLYGTAKDATANHHGIIFKLGMGLAPFVETVPTSRAVETSVTILGTNLSGATVVNFNGTTALFSVVSNSELTTNVPVGATSGTVMVMTPKRTMTSHIDFQVP